VDEWKIEGRMAEFGEGRPIEDCFFDGEGARANGLEAIFPIVQRDSEAPWKPIGTGFFISTMGMFATARHVLADRYSSAPYPSLYAIQINPAKREIHVREIAHIALHPTADVAIGFLHDKLFTEQGIRNKNRCFGLTRHVPAIGQKVAAFGYPKPVVSLSDDAFDLTFASCSFAGLLEEVYPQGRDSTLLRRLCFRTSMATAPGASGGPVAFGDGKVFALISSGIEGQPINFVSPITEILDLPIPAVRLADGKVRSDMKVADLERLRLLPIDWLPPSSASTLRP
jgi:S1-C subfamily serine protease